MNEEYTSSVLCLFLRSQYSVTLLSVSHHAQVQGRAKERSLSCEKVLPGCAWLMLNKHVQRWDIRWALGCVNPASWLPLAVSSRNLGSTLCPTLYSKSGIRIRESISGAHVHSFWTPVQIPVSQKIPKSAVKVNRVTIIIHHPPVSEVCALASPSPFCALQE